MIYQWQEPDGTMTVLNVKDPERKKKGMGHFFFWALIGYSVVMFFLG